MATNDVQESFMYRSLQRLEKSGCISSEESFLVVFGGQHDRDVMRELGYSNFTLSNIDPDQSDGSRKVDAANLPYASSSYDYVVAHAGLHHASRPHQSVCEMYRVARQAAIFFESQDSFLMRLAVSAGLVAEYEWNAILDHGLARGGVDDSPIPNYVYRWTRREVEKLARSLDPVREPHLIFMAEWDLSYRRLARRLQRTPLSALGPRALEVMCKATCRVANGLAGRQGNAFMAGIIKDGASLQPWIAETTRGLVFDPTRLGSRIEQGGSEPGDEGAD